MKNKQKNHSRWIAALVLMLSLTAAQGAWAGSWVNTEGNHHEGRSVKVVAIQISGVTGLASVLFEEALNGGYHRFHFVDLNPQAVKQMYATLLTAKITGKTVTVAVELNYSGSTHRIYDVQLDG